MRRPILYALRWSFCHVRHDESVLRPKFCGARELDCFKRSSFRRRLAWQRRGDIRRHDVVRFAVEGRCWPRSPANMPFTIRPDPTGRIAKEQLSPTRTDTHLLARSEH